MRLKRHTVSNVVMRNLIHSNIVMRRILIQYNVQNYGLQSGASSPQKNYSQNGKRSLSYVQYLNDVAGGGRSSQPPVLHPPQGFVPGIFVHVCSDISMTRWTESPITTRQKTKLLITSAAYLSTVSIYSILSELSSVLASGLSQILSSF